MWTKKNVLIAVGIILILALVLPMTNVLADPYKFLTVEEGQKNQTTQQQEEILPTDTAKPAINNNSNSTEATQLTDNLPAVDNVVAPSVSTNGQPVTTAQSPKQVQNAPQQQVQNVPQPVLVSPPAQNTPPNTMNQSGPGYSPGWDCAPMAPIPPDYQPNYEWYDNGNSWRGRSMGHW